MRQTLLSFLTDYKNRGEQTAFARQDGLRRTQWSYADLVAGAAVVARVLEAHGVGKGDRVLLLGENSAEWVAAFWGCLLRGAVAVPLDVQSAPDFISRVQAQVNARLLLHDGVKFDRLAVAEHDLPAWSLANLSNEIKTRGTGRQITDELSASEGTAEAIGPDDIVEIIYTSGTMAEPKGVVLTHRNLLTNLEPIEREIKKYLKWERLVHPIRFLNLVPLSHVFGQFMGIFVPQLIGGEIFFQSSLKPSEIIERTRRERISVIVAVPRMLDSLREQIERDWATRGKSERMARALSAAADWNPLRRWWAFRDVHRRFGFKFWAFVVGGATLPPEAESFWSRMGFVVVQGYGMTETASLISVVHPFKQRPGSIGETLPEQEVRLGPEGEIMVRGANVSPGYWRAGGGIQPLGEDEGWLSTGDIGELDERGRLYFKGRSRERIVTAAGVNIYPEDLEAALNRQPEVRSSVVIGFEGTHGPEPLAVLILRDETADPGAVIRRANEGLAQHQQMRRWFVWSESDFPRTPTQKVRRGKVAEAVNAMQFAGPDASGAGSANTLAEIIASISANGSPTQLDPAASLATELKLDSLGRVELMSALEQRYQIEIDETAFTSATTVGEVEELLRHGAISTAPIREYPYPKWAQRFPVTWLRFLLFYLLVLPLTRILSPMTVNGREHLASIRGPALFISNHVTYVDHALILSVLPRRLRHKLAIAMEGEILRDWRHPPRGTSLFNRFSGLVQYVLVAVFFNVFPLPHHSGFRRSFAYAGEAVDRGLSVMVFPEGRRTDDGQMDHFKDGTGLLVSGLNVPVVPIKLDGLFELKRQGRHRARPGEISLTIGEPVSFDSAVDPAEITRELEQRVRSL